MVKRAAEEEVRETPEGVEDSVVDEAFFNSVPMVDENHDGQANDAVKQVDHTEALNRGVCHGLQGPLAPLHDWS